MFRFRKNVDNDPLKNDPLKRESTVRDDLRMLFGFCVLGAITIIALVIAIGHVEEKTSYGLGMILGSLTSLAGGFTNWAFGQQSRRSAEGKPALSEKPELEQKSKEAASGA